MKKDSTNTAFNYKKRVYTFLVMILTGIGINSSVFAQGFTDQTRALYIMDISKYVEWPEEVMKKSDYFTIGVLTNKEELFYELDAIAKNRKTIQGKEIRLLFFRDINMIEPTRVLYVNKNEEYKIDKVLEKIKGSYTLLMGEGFEFRESMMNFVVLNDSPRFEVNESLLNSEGMTVKPIFLAQAVKSREDWQELFKVTEVELVEEKIITEEQRKQIAELDLEIEQQKKLIAAQIARLDSLNTAIEQKQSSLKSKEKVLQKYLVEIRSQKKLMADMSMEIERIKVEKKEMERMLGESRQELDQNIARNSELADQIKIQLKEIEKQKLITYFVSVFLLLMIGMVYVVYVNYRNKKKANIALEEKNALITRQKEEIKQQRDVAEMQRDQIAYQKKHITDSIEYAKRIQAAILPSLELFSDKLDHFVLYKPRDIVSGDFYWVNEMDNRLIIIAADCTGHGVPGAFMSMLGVSLLNEIVNNKGLYHPDEILNALREDIISSLKQVEGGSDVKDGMDMTVCTLDYKTDTLEFAGANNPLILFQDGELIQVKADKMPVAVHDRMDKFSLHKLKIKKGDTFYTFSDGFVDQFGGPQQKKYLSKNFRELLSGIQDKSMLEQGKLIDAEFENWRTELEQVDDVTIIGVRY
ncbi:MAG: YfiR/HmsC family protein [Bacteroidales bacterium]|nr:YfiR/HmsC family protein [Bacteroidales bacterium]MCF8404092.1 YfiR/HmsC family protein [Bacteroidales bacterium]